MHLLTKKSVVDSGRNNLGSCYRTSASFMAILFIDKCVA